MGDVVEDRIREAHQRGDFEEATRLALELYQPEVFAFLCARLRDEVDAREVLGQLREDLWRGIEKFAWRSSLRTWLYTLARHAAIRFERSPANQAARRERLSQVSEPAAVDRSQTRPYLRTEIKDAFAELRARMTPDEQSLLTLRIDRNLPWNEIAQILNDGEELDAANLRREAANLRQRFAQLKARIKEWAVAEGLLDD